MSVLPLCDQLHLYQRYEQSYLFFILCWNKFALKFLITALHKASKRGYCRVQRVPRDAECRGCIGIQSEEGAQGVRVNIVPKGVCKVQRVLMGAKCRGCLGMHSEEGAQGCRVIIVPRGASAESAQGCKVQSLPTGAEECLGCSGVQSADRLAHIYSNWSLIF